MSGKISPVQSRKERKGTSTCRIRLWRCSLAHILWRRNSDMARRSRSNGAAHWIEGKSENGSPYSGSVYCFDLRWTKRNGVVFFMKLTRISLSPLTHIPIDSAEQRSVHLRAIKPHFILFHQLKKRYFKRPNDSRENHQSRSIDKREKEIIRSSSQPIIVHICSRCCSFQIMCIPTHAPAPFKSNHAIRQHPVIAIESGGNEFAFRHHYYYTHFIHLA